MKMLFLQPHLAMPELLGVVHVDRKLFASLSFFQALTGSSFKCGCNKYEFMTFIQVEICTHIVVPELL